MTVALEEVTDLPLVERWHALESRSVPLDCQGMPAIPLLEAAALALAPSSADRSVLFVATDGDVDVASATVWLPMRDNLESATLDFAVDPTLRHRGYGEAVARALVAWVDDLGRSQLRFMAPAPLDGPVPSEPLARRLGAEHALEVVRRELDVRVLDASALDRFAEARVGDLADAYEVVTWVDRVPDALVDDAARLLGRMSTDAPHGTIEWEAERWDAARYREREDEAAARHRRRVAAGAVERATGRMVAYTDVGVSTLEPAYADQWDTIVEPEHRGHRLGIVVKVANLHHLRRVAPEVDRVGTWNATSNEHMVAINDELGFVQAGRAVHWLLTR